MIDVLINNNVLLGQLMYFLVMNGFNPTLADKCSRQIDENDETIDLYESEQSKKSTQLSDFFSRFRFGQKRDSKSWIKTLFTRESHEPPPSPTLQVKGVNTSLNKDEILSAIEVAVLKVLKTHNTFCAKSPFNLTQDELVDILKSCYSQANTEESSVFQVED